MQRTLPAIRDGSKAVNPNLLDQLQTWVHASIGYKKNIIYYTTMYIYSTILIAAFN